MRTHCDLSWVSGSFCCLYSRRCSRTLSGSSVPTFIGIENIAIRAGDWSGYGSFPRIFRTQVEHEQNIASRVDELLFGLLSGQQSACITGHSPLYAGEYLLVPLRASVAELHAGSELDRTHSVVRNAVMCHPLRPISGKHVHSNSGCFQKACRSTRHRQPWLYSQWLRSTSGCPNWRRLVY